MRGSCAKIIDNSVQVELRVIDQLDNGRVDMQDSVGFRRAHPLLRFRKIEARAGPPPTALAHELVPSRWCGKDFAEALGKDR